MAESRMINSLKNISASVIYQVVNLVICFVSRTVFIQVLGVGFLGINGLFNDVLSMLNLAELGFGTAMTYSMYKPLAEKDYATLAGLTNFYKKVYRIIAVSIAGIGLLIIPLLPYLVNLEQDIEHLIIYYLLFLASNIASYLVTYKTTILYADQKNYILIKYTAVYGILQTIVLIVLLIYTHNYIVYLVAQVAFVYAMNFHKSHAAQKRYPFINKKVRLPKEKTEVIFKDIGSAFVYKISTVLLTATDNTLISVLVSTEMVGYYSNYCLIVGKLGALISTLFSSLIASLGNLILMEKPERRFQVFQIMQSLSFIISTFFVSCVFLLEDDFIRIWLGEAYTLSTFSLIAIVISFYFSIALMPVITFREAAGLFRKTKYVMLWTAGINIALSILLGRCIGLAGILLSTSIAKLCTHFWYEPLLLFRNYFQKPIRSYFLEMLKGVVITIISILLAYAASFWLIPSSWVLFILKGVIVSTVCLTVIFFAFHKTDGFILLCKKVTTIIRREAIRRHE